MNRSAGGGRGTARWVVAGALLMAATLDAAHAGFSIDEDPTETPLDPGDVFLPGGILQVDDSCPPGPSLTPCIGVPDDASFDLDGVSIRHPVDVCGQASVIFPRGILFSLDDGDPGPGSGDPDGPVEIFFYDRCGVLGGGSYLTNATESLLGLGDDPPGTSRDDDVDAWEAGDLAAAWGASAIFFTPDSPSSGGLSADPACAGSTPGGTVYGAGQTVSPPVVVSSPCALGVPDVAHCNLDALTFVTSEPPFNGAALLFSTDAGADCGLDPGDIYISDIGGNLALWADDVNDLGIALTESQKIDLDALSLNEPGLFDIGDPIDPLVWKRAWCDYAPGGLPDFSQDHLSFPPGPTGGTLYDGPASVAGSFWWLDSEFEGNCGGSAGDSRDRHRLVERANGTPDDHSPLNVEPLIQDLALCMQADSAIPGTELTGMHQCIGHWLVDKDLKADYRVRSVVAPGIGEIACAVERGDTVALELGFWWGDATGGVNRCGGHWVAVSGVDLPRSPGPDGEPGVAGADDDGDGKVDDLDELCPCGAAGLTTYGDDFCPGPQRLARLGLSDPAFNNAEPPPAGAGGMGRVLGPDHANHAGSVLPVLPSHDDAQNVSHDVYFVRPGGLVFPLLNVLGYASADPAEPSVACAQVHRFCGQNPFPGIDLPFDACDPSDNVRISVEIEAMLALGPITNQVCLDFTGTDPAPLSVTLGPPIGPPCPAGVAGSTPLDYIRGQGCQLGFVPSTVPTAVTLGEVDVLEEQTPLLAWVDDTTPINTDPGVWYFLVKQPPPLNYGFGSDGLPRQAGRPPCP